GDASVRGAPPPRESERKRASGNRAPQTQPGDAHQGGRSSPGPPRRWEHGPPKRLRKESRLPEPCAATSTPSARLRKRPGRSRRGEVRGRRAKRLAPTAN